ncbi:MAG: haloalkane dehalogenase [Actinomycetota bacterium]|nr:haloalkane dehalogenase [Actinomycetota bacterium]
MSAHIDPVDPYERQRVDVLATTMAYVDTGSPEGPEPTCVFLHGNPTSSYLWRNVIRVVEPHARCLAPDLVGMGDSGASSSGSYRFADHAEHLDAWFDAVLPTGPLVLVLHDWGSALGFHWARRHPERVAGIAFTEAIVTPLTWDDWPQAATGIFSAMRSDAGERLVLENNVFVERILPASVLRDLGEDEMAVYRRRFAEAGESRRPTLTWPREIPIEGSPADVHEVVSAYASWLATHPGLPKTFVNADPGSILVGRQREVVRSWPDLVEVTLPGSHFVQEDSPAGIGEAVVALLGRS